MWYFQILVSLLPNKFINPVVLSSAEEMGIAYQPLNIATLYPHWRTRVERSQTDRNTLQIVEIKIKQKL